MRKCSELLGRAFTTSRLPGGATVTKRSPHCLHPSRTAVTLIISFTETAKLPISGSQLCNVKHQEGKHSVFIQPYLPMKPSCKTNILWNAPRETLFYTHPIQTVSNSALGSTQNLTGAAALRQTDKRHHYLLFLLPQVRPQSTVHPV